MDSPVRFRASPAAGIGPIPMIRGSTPAEAWPTIRPIGVRPSSLTAFSPASSTAAAPSLRGQELAAVTVPPSRKTGFSWASFSSGVSRGDSSLSKRTGSPFFWGTGTATISAWNFPASSAA